MLWQKILLLVVVFGFLACVAASVLYDVYVAFELSQILGRDERPAKAANARQTPA